ncbi:MAG: hypothetical protein WBQ24_16485 [Xanthobacteraceae bacterium]
MIRVVKFASISVLVVAAMAMSMGLVAPASAQGSRARLVAHHTNRLLYDVVSQRSVPVNSDDPSLTGGGSTGYNQMIYNW